MFKEQIGRNMEVYVDDLLVKSKKLEQHGEDLREAFGVLQYYKMKLNPKNFAFEVQSSKFLGFLVSKIGIEANPENVQEIIEMESLRNLNEVQSWLGK